MRRREERAIRYEAQDLVAEAEAVLNGRLMNRPWWNRKLVGWVSVNTLAHADWPTLFRLADGARCNRNQVWQAALSFLAAELLATAGTPTNLATTQRARLIPLELDMLTCARPGPSTPGDLVNLILPRIDRTAGRRRDSSTGWSPPGD